MLFLIGLEILPTKYLRKQKVSRFADKSTKFKKLPTVSEARGGAAPHAPPVVTPLIKSEFRGYVIFSKQSIIALVCHFVAVAIVKTREKYVFHQQCLRPVY